ncbi:Xaa-Pro dipeptidase [Taenia crassiceps]|uniref:Xaa-Pro dipeptidase n=1 Tax=Taenia crassiceps TaxID=6207 RepID=A0ABR4Q997_9CEST
MKEIGGDEAEFTQPFLDGNLSCCLDYDFPQILRRNAINDSLSLLTFSDLKQLGLTKADIRSLEYDNALLTSLFNEEKKDTNNPFSTHAYPRLCSKMESVFKLGKRGLAVPMALHKMNRSRLCERLRVLWSSDAPPSPTLDGVYVLLQGGSSVLHGGSDAEIVFRQESYFHWTFGGLEPYWYGAIEVATQRAILFIPQISESTAVYMGEVPSLSDAIMRYGVDEAHYAHEIEGYFCEKNPSLLLTLHGLNTDSGEYTLEASFDGIHRFKVDNSILHHEMAECRLIKSPLELEVIRYAVSMSSAAHRHLMRRVKPGMYQFQAESIFRHYCYFYGGMRHVAYTCIAATGCDCAVLHYGHAGAPNDNQIRDGDMCLFDMGGEYYCYCSDITCSFPVSGKFTSDQRLIYEAVLAAVRAVTIHLRPGGNVEEMMSAHLGATFMPHGLGHLMGCDVHDVGGYNKGTPPRSAEPGLKNLRTARHVLPNMVLTVEPGCYFIKRLIKKAQSSPELCQFLIPEAIDRFADFGGVRIEEDVLVTEDGCEVLSDVPRTVEEIESWMSRDSTEYDTLT